MRKTTHTFCVKCLLITWTTPPPMSQSRKTYTSLPLQTSHGRISRSRSRHVRMATWHTRCSLVTFQVHAGSMLPLLPVPVCRLCSHFRPRSRALLARMTFRTRWCATTTLTARTAVTRASVTSHPVTCSHTLTVATERYGVRFFPLGFCQFACLPVYSLVFLGLCQSVRSSACMPIVRLRVQLSVRLLVCMSASPSMSVLACFPVYSQSAFLRVSWWSPCLSPWLSHFLFLCLFGCLLVCLLVCRSACMFLCLLGGNLVCLHVSLVIHLVCLQVLLAVCLSLFVSIWWSPRLSLCLFGGLLVCLRVSLAVCLSAFVSLWRSACLSSCLLGGHLVRLRGGLFVCLHVYLAVFLFARFSVHVIAFMYPPV